MSLTVEGRRQFVSAASARSLTASEVEAETAALQEDLEKLLSMKESLPEQEFGSMLQTLQSRILESTHRLTNLSQNSGRQSSASSSAISRSASGRSRGPTPGTPKSARQRKGAHHDISGHIPALELEREDQNKMCAVGAAKGAEDMEIAFEEETPEGDATWRLRTQPENVRVTASSPLASDIASFRQTMLSATSAANAATTPTEPTLSEVISHPESSALVQVSAQEPSEEEHIDVGNDEVVSEEDAPSIGSSTRLNLETQRLQEELARLMQAREELDPAQFCSKLLELQKRTHKLNHDITSAEELERSQAPHADYDSSFELEHDSRLKEAGQDDDDSISGSAPKPDVKIEARTPSLPLAALQVTRQDGLKIAGANADADAAADDAAEAEAEAEAEACAASAAAAEAEARNHRADAGSVGSPKRLGPDSLNDASTSSISSGSSSSATGADQLEPEPSSPFLLSDSDPNISSDQDQDDNKAVASASAPREETEAAGAQGSKAS
eukprot:640200-Rhodomonas_salina.1